MENREEFEIFAAQYQGQRVAKLPLTGPYEGKLFSVGGFGSASVKYLELRDIVTLKDEELNLLFFDLFNRPEQAVLAPLATALQYYKMDCFDRRQVDYLRSIGIALPFRQYSVIQMVELGWIKLIS